MRRLLGRRGRGRRRLWSNDLDWLRREQRRIAVLNRLPFGVGLRRRRSQPGTTGKQRQECNDQVAAQKVPRSGAAASGADKTDCYGMPLGHGSPPFVIVGFYRHVILTTVTLHARFVLQPEITQPPALGKLRMPSREGETPGGTAIWGIGTKPTRNGDAI